ncbi:HpcH/HpaI aldolase/citrate lyase family protein [Cellulomonas denverensis]|uniref:CoA ester lyase n=1 Tax=Cellulomonas denverensis TaxID=264297 RepID=A0A7X6QZR2_9CELL|nr:CoA ester lyase [Cellulomonas denverensis]NKY23377.1 CoA ester lyase [Cellulomonas denverensis]GIG24333.1 CoA ester lyase [Cellulomonas denverensis]
MTRPVRTLLYAPADRPDLAAKALAGDADVVVLDLEDAVAPARKASARDALAGLIAAAPAGRPVQVRVNQEHAPWHADDLAAVAELPASVGLRVPKVNRPEAVRALAAALPGRPLHLLLEDALGIEHAFAVATADPAVATLGLGEADLRSDLGVSGEEGLAWVRSRVVTAARAAGLPAPAMSVYPHVTDLDGLRASCVAGRALGFVGRAAIHPRQLPAIRAAFTPDAAEVERAREVLDRVAGAHQAGVGAVVLADGTFLDVAMVERARSVVALAED